MTHSLDWLWMIRMEVNDKYENEMKWCYMTHSLDWLWMIRMVVNDEYENEMMLYDTLSRLAVNDKDGSKW